jgi:hypothetical protein
MMLTYSFCPFSEPAHQRLNSTLALSRVLSQNFPFIIGWTPWLVQDL